MTASKSFDDPARIGPYRILRTLGEGGMGVVYEAEQEEPVRRRVALKIIKLGMDTKLVVARFEAERQALAVMDHPNIAQVFDAGATDTGRPYFVMELVKGTPITEYCDAHKLSTEERLRLFSDVCRAVQHAHQKGVIHRDLKPGNVLVTVRDGEVVPKVIDFGLAKAIAGDLTDRTLVTEFGVMLGTPEYMSPEQADVTGLDVDTRTDIYSLGVLLYELLVGAPPFDLARIADAAARFAILEQDPPAPSARLTTLPGDTGEWVARHRRTDLRTLKGEVAGDLDWVVMKCLEKDRTRRYETANGLVLDIGRHLNHEPVLAASPGAVYRLRKFARRHRLGVAAAGVATTGLVLGVVLASLGLVRASAAERQASAEAAKATAVSRFLQQTLESADPYEGQGRDVTVLEALDEAVRRIEGAFADAPLVEAAVRASIGSTYSQLNRYAEADPLLTSALRIRSAQMRPDHPDVAESLHLLGVLRLREGRLEEADTLIRRALGLRRTAFGDGDASVLHALADLAIVRSRSGEYAQAITIGREVLAGRRSLSGDEHPAVALALHDLGWDLFMAGEYDEAEATLRRSVETYRRTSYDHPHAALAMASLGSLLRSRGSLEEAETLQREALAMRRRLLGDDHYRTGESLAELAHVLTDRGSYAETGGLMEESIAILRRALGPDHANVAAGLLAYGVMLDDQGRPAEGRARKVEAIDIYRRLESRGEIDRNYLATALNNLGVSLAGQNQCPGAAPLFLEAIEHYEAVLGAEHDFTANARSNYGGCLGRMGRHAEAEALLTGAYDVLVEARGASDRLTQRTVTRLVELYEAWGRPQEAARYRALLTGGG